MSNIQYVWNKLNQLKDPLVLFVNLLDYSYLFNTGIMIKRKSITYGMLSARM